MHVDDSNTQHQFCFYPNLLFVTTKGIIPVKAILKIKREVTLKP